MAPSKQHNKKLNPRAEKETRLISAHYLRGETIFLPKQTFNSGLD
jgi:hypothetical protein